ncbi:MAG: response regulator [Pseudomonadota bacterium]
MWYFCDAGAGHVVVNERRKAPRNPLEGIRALVAEDNVTNQLVAREMLQSLGVSVALAADGFEAVELAGREPFDVFLIDIEMPRLSGIDVIQRLRAAESRHRDAAIVALTAYVMPDQRRAIEEAGADGIIPKPLVSIQAFGDAVAQFIERRKAMEAGDGARGDAGARGGNDGAGVDDADPRDAPTGGSAFPPAGDDPDQGRAPECGGERSGDGEERRAASPEDFDPSVLRRLSDLAGDESVGRLLQMARADIDRVTAALIEALEGGDRQAVKFQGHSLAGMAGAVGAVGLEREARAIDRDPEAAMDRRDRLVASLRAIRQRTGEWLGYVEAGRLGALGRLPS